MRLVDVGAVEDFPDRTMTVVDAGGLEVGVCHWGSEFFALHNRCPHQAAPVCRGFLQERLAGRCGPDGVELEAGAEEPTILCAWHRWEFSVRTGESAWDPRYRIKTFPVRVEGGRVLLQVGRR